MGDPLGHPCGMQAGRPRYTKNALQRVDQMLRPGADPTPKNWKVDAFAFTLPGVSGSSVDTERIIPEPESLPR